MRRAEAHRAASSAAGGYAAASAASSSGAAVSAARVVMCAYCWKHEPGAHCTHRMCRGCCMYYQTFYGPCQQHHLAT